MYHDQGTQLFCVECNRMTCLQIDLEDRECTDDSYRADCSLGGPEQQGRHREVPVDRLQSHVEPDRKGDRRYRASECEAEAESVQALRRDDVASRLPKVATTFDGRGDDKAGDVECENQQVEQPGGPRVRSLRILRAAIHNHIA